MFTLYQKYDSLVECGYDTSLLMLAHCAILMFNATKIIKKCSKIGNYS